MSITITNHLAKWFQNKSSWTKMTWWKTSFNMPVTNIFASNSIYTETEWVLNAIWEATNFDLSWFQVWWEAIAWSSVFTIYWPFTWWNVTAKQDWKNPDWITIFTNQATINLPSLDSWSWQSYQLVSNQWVAAWEISWNWTYKLVATASWAISWTTVTNFTISNCPNTAITYTPWMIWVEWNNLRFTSANWHIHTIYWNIVSSHWASPWYIWSNTSNWDIFWTWTSWNVYVWPVLFKQFASIFSNWASWTTFAWIDKQWYIWLDNQFWWEHISYIASDWYKWLMPSWNNPYI